MDKSILLHLGITFLVIIIPNRTFGQENEAKQYNINEEGVLIGGYDVVSYFMGSVAKGKESINLKYSGIELWFSSEENLEVFQRNPAKFIPAYGGWCAYAIGDSGKKVKIDPETYKIIEGKLYLFYNFYFKNTLISWNKNEVNLINNADINWQKIIE